MVIIKKAKASDLSSVSILFDAYRVFYRKESDIEGAKNFIGERINNNESTIYLALENDVPVGFTQLYPLFSSTRMKRIWLLNDLYIDESHRGKGISKLLLNEAKKLAKATNAAAVILETETTNDIGNNLYPSAGFTLDSNNHYFWENK